jgi:hypothetical protein
LFLRRNKMLWTSQDLLLAPIEKQFSFNVNLILKVTNGLPEIWISFISELNFFHFRSGQSGVHGLSPAAVQHHQSEDSHAHSQWSVKRNSAFSCSDVWFFYFLVKFLLSFIVKS